MNEQLAKKIFSLFVNGKIKWNHKDRIDEVEKFAYSMSTGTNQGDMLDNIRPKTESKNQKDQRRNITNTLTKYILQRPRNFWKRVKRSKPITFFFDSENGEAQQIVESMIKKALKTENIIDHCFDEIEHNSFFHPNSFIGIYRVLVEGDEGSVKDVVLETEKFTGEQVVLRNPEEELKFIMFKKHIVKADGTNDPNKYELIMYYDNIRHSVQVDKKSVTNEMAVSVPFGGVPVFEMGCYPDAQTNKTTNVSAFDGAEHVLKDLIRNKSLEDVNLVQHVYAKRYQYVARCKARHKKHGVCQRGYYGGVESKETFCTSCKGTGKKYHGTEQDVISMFLPDKADHSDILDLAKISHIEQLAEFLPKHLKEKVNEAENRVINAVFNRELIQEKSIAKTATEAYIEYDQVYDTLFPFAKRVAEYVCFLYKGAAAFRDLQIMFGFEIDDNFQLETMQELINRLKALKESGAASHSIDFVTKQIAERQFRSNPLMLARMRVEEQYRPFSGKADAQIAFILQSRAVDDPQRVLFENFKEVFDILYSDPGKPFHTKSPAERKKALQAAIEQHQQTIKTNSVFSPIAE